MTTVGRGAVADAAAAVNAPEPPPMAAATNNGGGGGRRSAGGGTSRDPAPFQGRENWRLAPHGGTNDYDGSRMSAGGTGCCLFYTYLSDRRANDSRFKRREREIRFRKNSECAKPE